MNNCIMPQVPVSAQQKELLVSNLFFLYDHRQEVFSNPAYFYAPIFLDHHLSIMGNYPFRNATLGAHLLFLQDSPFGLTVDAHGHPALLFYIAGSPLSGSNACAFITREGQHIEKEFTPFRPVWESYIHYCDNCLEGGNLVPNGLPKNTQTLALSQILEELHSTEASPQAL